MNKINRNVAFIDSFLGMGTYINNSSFFLNTKIGRFCSIGSNVRVITGVHPLGNNISTHPSFYSLSSQAGFTFSSRQLYTEEKYSDKNNKYHVIIENDVWIGANVLLLSGITIKNGSVIATGSVVTKDVEPYSIVAGVPAKKIKYRFTEEEINYLLNVQWWDRPIKWIQKNHLNFQNIVSFKKANEDFIIKQK